MDERDSLHFIRFAHSSRNDSFAVINITTTQRFALQFTKTKFSIHAPTAQFTTENPSIHFLVSLITKNKTEFYYGKNCN